MVYFDDEQNFSWNTPIGLVLVSLVRCWLLRGFFFLLSVDSNRASTPRLPILYFLATSFWLCPTTHRHSHLAPVKILFKNLCERTCIENDLPVSLPIPQYDHLKLSFFFDKSPTIFILHYNFSKSRYKKRLSKFLRHLRGWVLKRW